MYKEKSIRLLHIQKFSNHYGQHDEIDIHGQFFRGIDRSIEGNRVAFANFHYSNVTGKTSLNVIPQRNIFFVRKNSNMMSSKILQRTKEFDKVIGNWILRQSTRVSTDGWNLCRKNEESNTCFNSSIKFVHTELGMVGDTFPEDRENDRIDAKWKKEKQEA